MQVQVAARRIRRFTLGSAAVICSVLCRKNEWKVFYYSDGRYCIVGTTEASKTRYRVEKYRICLSQLLLPEKK